MSNQEWLEESKQSIISPLIRKHVNQVEEAELTERDYERMGNHPDPLRQKIVKTMRYLHDLNHTGLDKMRVFRRRSSHDIIEQGISPTCSDYGILFRVFMITGKIPTSYLEAIHTDSIINPSREKIHSHSFNRVYGKNEIVVVDPHNLKMFNNNESLHPYIVSDEALDSWDLGICSYQDLMEYRDRNLDRLKSYV